jgi:hypothetical protein
MTLKTQPTVLARVSNQRAGTEREGLFAALEKFVNAGDTEQELRELRTHSPEFFPAWLYEDAEYWAQQEPGLVTPLRWYKAQLRKVWEGRDPKGVRLAILLGIARQPYWSEEDFSPSGELPWSIQLDPTFEQDALEWFKFTSRGLEVYRERKTPGSNGEEYAIGSLPPSRPSLNWRSGDIQYAFDTDFQRALYALMRQSWRARICRVCAKYFIAIKSASQYCSTRCAGDAKQERDRVYFRQEGSKKRALRLKKKAQRKNS